MKKLHCISLLLLFLCLCSCGSSKKVEKSPIKTFVMPCSELVSGNGVLRAWASGRSDNETAARKKAQAAAAAELAAMLSRTVQATTEDYTTALSGADRSESRSLLNDKVKISVNETLKGATIACDRWTHDEATGQYTNYIVMELQGEEFLKILYETLGSSRQIDRELLRKLFMENIDKSAKKE